MPEDIQRIVATDCGSTTTKAILIERSTKGEYRLVARGEAPTTVEKPFEDVTRGVLNSITELEEITEETIPEGYPAGRRTLRMRTLSGLVRCHRSAQRMTSAPAMNAPATGTGANNRALSAPYASSEP